MTAAGGSRTVLVVDDDPVIVEAMAVYLRLRGLEIVSTSVPEEVPELLQLHAPVLAIIDVRMPGIDGPALVRLLRGLPRGRDLEVIFFSAIDEEELAAIAAQVEGARHVCKTEGVPFLLQEITRRYPHLLVPV